jgi:hypothetical protein
MLHPGFPAAEINLNNIVMKTASLAFVVLFMLCTFLFTSLAGQDNSLAGKWEGIFMDQFRMVITFKQKDPNKYSGNLKMYQDHQLIQDDGLTDIRLISNQVSFYIPAKNTPFSGELMAAGKAINGRFTFPDGSKHALFITRSVSAEEQVPDPFEDLIAAEKLKEDLHFLASKLKSQHPALYRFQDEKSFDNLVIEQVSRISDSMTLAEFYQVASSLTHAVGCSHTGVRLPGKSALKVKASGNYFPAGLFFKNGHAYLIGGPENNKHIPPGSKIISINGKPIKEIIADIKELVPAEGNNRTTAYYEMNQSFSTYFIYLDNAPVFEVVFENTNSVKFTRSMKACNLTELPGIADPQSLVMDGLLSMDCSIREEQNTATITLPTFNISDINYYIGYMDSLFLEFREREICHLILDLRGNSGGHPIFAAQLFSYLTHDPFIYFDSTHKVQELAPLYQLMSPNPFAFNGASYVLVDGGCLSTTGHLVSLLKYHNTSIIVGEEPGSSYRCNDMSRQFYLPNSGIEANIPTKIFSTAVKGFDIDTRVVDVHVELSLSDVMQKKDGCADKVDELIRPGINADL